MHNLLSVPPFEWVAGVNTGEDKKISRCSSCLKCQRCGSTVYVALCCMCVQFADKKITSKVLIRICRPINRWQWCIVVHKQKFSGHDQWQRHSALLVTSSRPHFVAVENITHAPMSLQACLYSCFLVMWWLAKAAAACNVLPTHFWCDITWCQCVHFSLCGYFTVIMAAMWSTWLQVASG